MFSLLYIDDEPDLLDLGKTYLEETGEFAIDAATSASEGLSLLGRKEYDAVISDYQMPRMDGIAFLRKIRASHRDIPFILFTGKGREEVVIDAFNSGADGYIQKGGDPISQFMELAHRTKQLIRRRRAEESLRDSEERFRGMAERSSDVIIICDETFRITYISPSIKSITGIDPGEIIGSAPSAQLFEKEDADRIFSATAYDRANKTPGDLVMRIKKSDGDRAFLEARGTPIFRNGEFAGLQIQGRDITGRKRAEDALQRKNEELAAAFEELTASEEELRQNYEQLAAFQKTIEASEARFRTLFEMSPDGIILADLTGCVTYASPSALTMFRVSSPDEVLGTSVFDWIEPHCLDRAHEAMIQLLGGKSQHSVTYQVRRRDGSSFYVETSQAVLPDANGRPGGFIVFVRDITDRQHAESILRESEEKFRALVEHSLDGILITDFTGKLLFANQAAGRIVDAADYQALIGIKNVLEFVAPESRIEVLRDFSKVMAGIDAYLVHYKLITETKREVWVECIGKKIPFRGSTAMLVSMRDVTERKLAEEKLRESEHTFATIFRRSPVALTLVSAEDGTFIDVNEVFSRKTGYAREAVIGKTSAELGIFADPGEHERMVSLLRSEGFLSGMEVRFSIQSGALHTCLISSSVIQIGGKPYILSTIEDITERKNTESAFQAMFRSMVGTTGLDSLDKITGSVSSWLGAECVMIGEIQPDKQSVKVLSMILDGKQVYDFSYTLAGTPCENVAEKGFCLYPDNAIQLFPAGKDLADLNIRGYIGTPLRNSAGEIIGILCVLSRSPITAPPSLQEIMEVIAVKAAAEMERCQMESARRESEEKFRTLVEYSLDGIIILDLTGLILFGNNAAGRIMDIADGTQLIGQKNVLEFIHPDSLPDVLRDFGQVAQGIDAYLVNYKVITATGREIWIECIGKRFVFRGSPALLVSMRDTTARKAAEQALADEEAKRRILIGQSKDGIVILNQNGGVYEANRQFAEMLGYSSEEMQNLHVWDWDKQIEREKLLEMIRTVDEAGDHFETRHQRKDGSVVDVEISTNASVFGNEKLIFCVVRDTTARKRMENAIRRANRQLNLLSSITRHDVLNKISIIQGYITIARKRGPEQDYSAILAKIETSTRAIQSQIEFTRIYQTLGTKDPAWQNPSAFLAAESLPPSVVLDNKLGKREIFADLMLERVFHNLVDNSLRHGGNVTEIRLSSRKTPEGLILVFEDNGIGIPGETKERIFERGYGNNTGLGLFLSREILAITGITIRETGEPKKGARFEILVPEGNYREEVQ